MISVWMDSSSPYVHFDILHVDFGWKYRKWDFWENAGFAWLCPDSTCKNLPTCRGSGQFEKLKTFSLPNQGLKTVPSPASVDRKFLVGWTRSLRLAPGPDSVDQTFSVCRTVPYHGMSKHFDTPNQDTAGLNLLFSKTPIFTIHSPRNRIQYTEMTEMKQGIHPHKNHGILRHIAHKTPKNHKTSIY